MALRPDSELWNYFTNIPEDGVAECKLCKHHLRNNRSFKLKQHLKNFHKNRREIDKYFDFIVEEDIAVCKTCQQRLLNRTGNLRLHMRRHHQIEVKLLGDKPTTRPTLKITQPYDEDQITADLEVAKRKMIEQVSIDEKRPTRRLCIKTNRNTIARSVIGLIVEDGASPQLFRSKHVIAILRPIFEAISVNEGKEFKMDGAYIERIINSIANYIRNDFSNDLHCRLLSITIDTDLNDSPNTFCISAQFITDGEIQKRILGIIDLEHECQLKEDHIKQILYKYNIDSNQIISAFWNNAKGKFTKEVKNSEYLKEMEEFELYPDLFLGDVEIEPYLGTKAQLCLLDIFKNSNIFQPFLQCRNLAKFISDECNGYYELFILNDINIPQVDSPWKVGSTCKMINDLHNARNYLKNVKFEAFEHPEDQFNLNEDLWSFIEAFCKSTSYLQKSILKYYNEELHIGDFYAQWLKCKLLTEQLFSANNKNQLLSMILAEVLKAIENRTRDLLNKDYLVACLYLDPRFQRIMIASQSEKSVQYLKKLCRQAKLFIDDDSESNEVPAQLYDDEDALLTEFLSTDIHVKDIGFSDVFNKIERLSLAFKSVDTNILLYWRDQKVILPELYTLSTICFAIPATEIYNKTRYSNVYRLETASELSPYTQENLLNIRINAHLLNDALSHLQLISDDRSVASSTLSDSELECYDISGDEDSNAYSTISANSGIESPSTIANIKPRSTVVLSKELPSKEL